VVGKGSKASGKKLMKEEVLPSPHGIRVAPKIPDELRKKAAQAVAAKDRKDGKVYGSKYFHINCTRGKYTGVPIIQWFSN
jgi:hypothetical protein